MVHVAPLPTSIQSLLLLYQVMEGRQAVSARYYRVLYQKLLDTQMAIHSAQQVQEGKGKEREIVCVALPIGHVPQCAVQVT